LVAQSDEQKGSGLKNMSVRYMSCPPDKILNPASGRCVLRTGAIGKKLVAKEKANGKRPANGLPTPPPAPPAAAPCPPNKILNPATKKCVLRTGAIGKKLVAKEKANGKRPANGPANDRGRKVTTRTGLTLVMTGEKDAKGFPVAEAEGGVKYAWLEATKDVTFRTVAARTGKTYVNTGRKNALGRPIVAGPKGGGYAWVEATKNVTKVSRTEPRPPRPPRPPRTSVPSKIQWRGTSTKLPYPKIQARYSNGLGNRNAPFETLVEKMNHVIQVFNVAPANATAEVTATMEKVIAGDIVATRKRNMDPSWLEKQARFLSELNMYDLMTVIGYTVRSHRWLGPYQRDGKLPGTADLELLNTGIRYQPSPLFPQFRSVCKGASIEDVFENASPSGQKEAFLGKDSALAYKAYVTLLKSGAFKTDVLRRAIDLFIRDLDRIIARAPPLEAPMVVYRGTKFDVFEGVPGRVYHIDMFSSAAFDLKWALMYAGHDKRSGLIQRITLARGTRVLAAALVNLWHADGEYEVIMPRGTYEIIGKPATEKMIMSGGQTQTKKVTDVVFHGETNMTPNVVMTTGKFRPRPT